MVGGGSLCQAGSGAVRRCEALGRSDRTGFRFQMH